MRELWSESQKRLTWRKIWVALAEAQAEFGLVSPSQLDELRAAGPHLNINRSLDIEASIHHDLMAEVRAFAEQCPTAGGVIHLGATSMDIEDNAEVMRMREALHILIRELAETLSLLAGLIRQHAATPVMAFTHLQPAEPSSLGYRLSFHAQDLMADLQELRHLSQELRGKGFKGAVGTAASYYELIGEANFDAFEQHLSNRLGIPFFEVTSQTYPRRQDYLVLASLAGLGATLSKFAFDLRILQSPVIGEWSEPFAAQQVGSSAMPFKRNPINAEKINSLARMLSTYPQVAWQNAALSLLERTLDDSANRRTIIPESFLVADELLRVTNKILRGLKVNLPSIQRNLDVYAPFAVTERLLMALVKAGADRQEMHERLRAHAMRAWQAIQSGSTTNPLLSEIAEDSAFQQYLSPAQIKNTLRIDDYLGIAVDRSHRVANQIVNLLESVNEVK